MDIIHIEKYYDQIHQRYPELSEKQIEGIVKRGLRIFFMLHAKGCDTVNKSPAYVAYTGRLFRYGDVYFKYWLYRKKIKLRLKYIWNGRKYNGHSYFGLREEEYKKYKSKIGKSGRRRKKIKFENIRLCKLLDECFLNKNLKYFFEVDIEEQDKFEKWYSEFEIKDFRLIYKRKADNTLEPVSNE